MPKTHAALCCDAAGGATRITGYRRISIRTLSAIAISHGFDASVCTHELAPTVVVELVNRTVHSPSPLVSNGLKDFAEKAKAALNATDAVCKTGGSCATITLACSAQAHAHTLNDLLATARVIDIWALKDKLVVLFAGTPKHTSALTHLREHRPELFSPQHCRAVADKTIRQTRRTTKIGKRGAATETSRHTAR